jgi:hypothetical protein
MQDIARHLLQAAANRPAVKRLERENLQEKQIQCALDQIRWSTHMRSIIMCLPSVSKRKMCHSALPPNLRWLLTDQLDQPVSSRGIADAGIRPQPVSVRCAYAQLRLRCRSEILRSREPKYSLFSCHRQGSRKLALHSAACLDGDSADIGKKHHGEAATLRGAAAAGHLRRCRYATTVAPRRCPHVAHVACVPAACPPLAPECESICARTRNLR